jgi:hypothetical protein
MVEKSVALNKSYIDDVSGLFMSGGSDVFTNTYAVLWRSFVVQ